MYNNTLARDAAPADIHAVMKMPFRHIYGRVQITYTDPLLESAVIMTVSDEAYNSNKDQLLDSILSANGSFFTLYENNLEGGYIVSSVDDHVGWTSAAISDANGVFADPPYVLSSFPSRPIASLYVFFDTSRGNVIEDFTVTFTKADGTSTTETFTGNTTNEVQLVDQPLADIVSVKLTVLKVSKPFYPATILDLPATSSFWYNGYQARSDLISIDLLEELTYEDDVEALGGVSANEVTIVLDNTDRLFNITNKDSFVARQLKRNRRIEPWLGAEMPDGEIEWYRLGTYWSYSWDVPYNSLTASVTGFDTIGLLDITRYENHQVCLGKSLGFLIDYVLSDAKQLLPFLEWEVDSELYEVIVPYAWFEAGSHAAALRRISQAYPMHIYCARNGRIIAAPQRLRKDTYVDTWSDSTNVVDKTYSSLYTVLPNIINVNVINPALVVDDELVTDELAFNVSTTPTRVLNFNAPYVEGINVTVDKDATVSYAYQVYSWGISFSFTGSGMVRSIVCTGTTLDTSNTSLISHRDEESVRTNGAVVRDISADFIQTDTLATTLLNRLEELSAYDIYDADVTYRGDIALTINDSILLVDGIAPDNRYTIKRHQLTWDGGLTGTAVLNT